MKKNIKNILIIIVLSYIALIVNNFFRIAWFHAFLNDRVFSVPFGLIYISSLIDWSSTLITFSLFGYIAERFVKFRKNLLGPIFLGVACSLVWVLSSNIYFAEQAKPIDYIWEYARYTMPAIGGLLGGLLAMKVGKMANKRVEQTARR